MISSEAARRRFHPNLFGFHPAKQDFIRLHNGSNPSVKKVRYLFYRPFTKAGEAPASPCCFWGPEGNLEALAKLAFGEYCIAPIADMERKLDGMRKIVNYVIFTC